MRFNPFRPNNPAPIGMFEGRMEELRAMDAMLYNTKHGNPQHFLLHGERGIGKSSLLLVEEITAKGDVPAFEGEKFNFLVVSISLENNDTYETVLDKLAKGLRITCKRTLKAKEFLKDTFDVLSRFEAAGVKLREKEASQSQSPLMDLATTYVTTCEEIRNHRDGVLLLIDEADKAPASANLGSILKALAETVAHCDNNVLAIGLAGTSVLISNLRASHESSVRLFTHFHLDALSELESSAVVDAAISEANEKSKQPLTITDGARLMLVKLSEGFPSFIQEFGFAAVQADKDNILSEEDVQTGAWAEHGAFYQLGEKYFKHLYLEKITSKSYRDLLQTMATHEDKWISKDQLRKESGLADSRLTKALQTLLARQIILSQDGNRGFYRLPSKSFSAWLRSYKLKKAEFGAPDLLEQTLLSTTSGIIPGVI